MLPLTYGLAWLFFNSAYAQTESRPYLMVSAGDSITAAFAANTNAVRGTGNLASILRNFADNKNTLSWATGDQIQSHATRLERYLLSKRNASLVVHNVAKTGAKLDDLAAQADLILETWKSGQYRALTYVTLLIGANDACAIGTDREQTDVALAKYLKAFFEKLSVIRQSEPIHLFVSALPRVPDLELPAISQHRTSQGATCKQMHFRFAPLCRALLDWQGTDGYLIRVQRVERANLVLERTLQEIMPLYPQFKIFFSQELFQQPIDAESLAADCFHPNQRGQERLAELFWEQQPWFK